MMKIKKILLITILLQALNVSQAQDTLFVKGKYVDVSEVNVDAPVFPQNRTFNFKSPIPKQLLGKKYTSTLIDYRGVEEVKCNKEGVLHIAYPNKTLKHEDWNYTGENFDISSARKYYIYKHDYQIANVWLKIPNTKRAPTLVFADEVVWTNSRQIPGTVITKVEVIKKMSLTNPAIVILPDGDYLASISGGIKTRSKNKTSFYISSDKGETWRVQAKNNIQMNYGNLFLVENKLYMMGATAPRHNVIISTSKDKGLTWTTPKNDKTGILLKGSYHSAPVPTVIHKGRVWRAMETNTQTGSYYKEAFIMSAPIDSDLLDASNWTISDKIGNKADWIKDNGRSFKQWLEGNAVVDRAGNVVNILRMDEQKEDGIVAIVTLSGTKKALFNPKKDIIKFPGGGKKFTIRYDEKSGKYWALSNAVFKEDFGKQHSGIYRKGLNCGLIRNRLVLSYSDDLRNWAVKDTLISSNDSFFHGFQYVDWQFDGDDIIAVSRTAFEEERGLPVRQHDANFFLFHRFSNFRTDKIQPILIPE